jgi:hypothetical protein
MEHRAFILTNALVLLSESSRQGREKTQLGHVQIAIHVINLKLVLDFVDLVRRAFPPRHNWHGRRTLTIQETRTRVGVNSAQP